MHLGMLPTRVQPTLYLLVCMLRCIFRFVLVCLETYMFVSVVLIPVRNTESNRKKIFFWFRETNRNTTETD
jgi:hypothetical protein